MFFSFFAFRSSGCACPTHILHVEMKNILSPFLLFQGVFDLSHHIFGSGFGYQRPKNIRKCKISTCFCCFDRPIHRIHHISCKTSSEYEDSGEDSMINLDSDPWQRYPNRAILHFYQWRCVSEGFLLPQPRISSVSSCPNQLEIMNLPSMSRDKQNRSMWMCAIDLEW